MKLTVNDIQYEINCISCWDKTPKSSNNPIVPSLLIGLSVLKNENQTGLKMVKSREFKNSYLSEKISDHIQYLINGGKEC